GERAGIANDGLDGAGIPLMPDTEYHATVLLKAEDNFPAPLTVSLEAGDHRTILGSARIDKLEPTWKRYTVPIRTGSIIPRGRSRLTLSTTAKGTLWINYVSLFPPTYHNRPNGNRVDIMEKLANLHPAFLRFPGGNSLLGETLDGRFNWKQT